MAQPAPSPLPDPVTTLRTCGCGGTVTQVGTDKIGIHAGICPKAEEGLPVAVCIGPAIYEIGSVHLTASDLAAGDWLPRFLRHTADAIEHHRRTTGGH